MIVEVISRDNVKLYTRVKANAASIEPTRQQLQRVADTRTAAELEADEYYRTAAAAEASAPGSNVIAD